MNKDIIELLKTNLEINKEIRRKLSETSLPPMVFQKLDDLIENSDSQLKALYQDSLCNSNCNFLNSS